MKNPATLQMIADELGISRVHVARAIYNRGYVKEDLKARILRTAEKLNYVPNHTATALVSRKSLNILFYASFNQIYYNIHSPVIRYISIFSDILQRRAFRLQVVSSELGKIEKIPADGIIIPYLTNSGGINEFVRNNELPVATFYRYHNKIHDLPEGTACVALNSTAGLRKMADTAIAKNIRKVCMLDFSREGILEKNLEIRKVFRNAGIDIKEQDVFQIERVTENIILELLKLIPRLRDYGLCILGNELLAIHFYQAAAVAGLKIPEDLSLAGYDNAEFTSQVSPPLSSVFYSMEEVCEKTVDLLMAKINREPPGIDDPYIIDTDFVDRGSIA